jgi:hypothetical protein
MIVTIIAGPAVDELDAAMLTPHNIVPITSPSSFEQP